MSRSKAAVEEGPITLTEVVRIPSCMKSPTLQHEWDDFAKDEDKLRKVFVCQYCWLLRAEDDGVRSAYWKPAHKM